MEIQKIPSINKQHRINKNAVDEVITTPAQTRKKDDTNKGVYINPYIPVAICDNLIFQNVYLSKCITTFAEDMIYNDINIKTSNGEEVEVEDIILFWEDNQEQLCDVVKDHLSYGFGGAEILFDEDTGKPAELKEISADTLNIKKERRYNPDTGDYDYYYYACHKINGEETLLRLYDHDYPPVDDDLHICLWLGGGRKSDYFSYPVWLECFNHVSASVSLDLLDAQKLADGNLISGILVIRRPPSSPNEEDVQDTLEEKMENKGSGIFTLELTTLNPNIPLEVDYIQISESNYDYLEKLAEKSDIKILANFKMPKARLLIDDTTESMNSNKTNTLYKIYSLELNNSQRPIEKDMRKFNKKYFKNNDKVEIVTPVFIDEKDIETDTTIKSFNNGLITFGQAIKKLQSIYPEYNEIDIDFDNPIYNERYYNGNPFGLSEPTQEEIDFYEASKFVDAAVIEEAINR